MPPIQEIDIDSMDDSDYNSGNSMNMPLPRAPEVTVSRAYMGSSSSGYRGNHKRMEPTPPTSAPTSASHSSTSSVGKYTRPSSSSASLLSVDHEVDDEDDDEDDDAYDARGLHGMTSSFRQPASSFSVDQSLANSRDSLMVNHLGSGSSLTSRAGRDSLLVTNGEPFDLGSGGGGSSSGGGSSRGGNQAPRQTEYGSDVMRMDDGYRTASLNAKRIAPGVSVDGLTPLLQAARMGDLVLLNALIIQPGTDILRRDPVYGQTALHFAIRGGHLPIVQALLMPEIAGSIVNVPDSRRNTALHLAAAKSRRMAKLLIDAGADVNFLNMRNQTPLGVHILTVTRDEPTMTEILLQARANPDAPVDKSTALHVALDKGLLQIAQRLVRHGARLDLKDERKRSVFDKVDNGVLKMLLSKLTHAPMWIPDTEQDACMECKKKFGTLGTRRHHCRYCGRLVCAKCASCQVKGTQFPFRLRRKQDRKRVKKQQRVCTTCYETCREANFMVMAEATS